MSQSVYHAAQPEYGDYQQQYVPVSGLYYQTEDGQTEPSGDAAAVSVVSAGDGHLLMEQADGNVLLYMDRDSLAMSRHANGGVTEEDGRLGSHIDVKFCKQEMEFLHENFEAADGASLPRSLIYGQYQHYCRHQLGNITPMNPASFGKLIRLVFAGIKTRRLGTRGHSKYHYYGIRMKPTSVLGQIAPEELRDFKASPSDSEAAAGNENSAEEGSDPQQQQQQVEGPTPLQLQHQQFLGDASAVVLDFGSVKVDDNELLPEGISLEHLSTFEVMYVTHCEDLLEAVKTMQLAAIPELWKQFWSGSQSLDASGDDADEMLPPYIMNMIGHVEALHKYVRQADYTFYTMLIDILIPDVLRPIPSSLTLVLRNFAKNLEGWLDIAMNGVAKEMVDAKKVAASAFAQMLRRYTGLNHLAQAARTVLQNKAQVNKMYQDLSKVDFVHVQEQAAWVCECEDTVVHQLQLEVKRIFQLHYNLEQWASWLDEVTTHVLQDFIGTPEFSRAARQFILKWSFYSSLVLRDLTLRSASSFGAFHLIRLLFDEYMFYCIEHKVAAATGMSVIAAFGNIKQFVDFSNIQPMDAFVEPFSSFPPEEYGAAAGVDAAAVSSFDAEASEVVGSNENNMFTLQPQTVSYVDAGGQTQTTVILQPITTSGDVHIV
jgi:regulatory factor X 1/2/3